MSVCSDDTQIQTTHSEVKKACPRVTRFTSAILVIFTIALVQLLAQSLVPSLGFIAQALIVLTAAFAHEWCGVHSAALTRQKRAYFDVSNVLETYQPRARTHGHLFQPEPPTPGVVQFAEGTQDIDASKNAAFNNARDSHYANMYEHAMKMAKEAQAMEKAAASPNMDVGSSKSLTEADPAKDKEEYELKKKKEAEDYKKQLEKPFSC